MKPAWIRSLAFVVLALAAGANASAQDSVPRKDLEKRLDIGLYDVTAAAAKLFNAGNEEGCCRLFEGALRTAAPLLDHYPELKKRAAEKLEKARNLPSMNDRAFLLREVVDDIRTTLKKAAASAPPKPSPMPVPPRVMSLWDRLGGEDAVKAVVHEAVAAAAKDPKVNLTRNGKYKLDDKGIANLEKVLIDFISANTGGSRKYTGLDMKTAHAGMAITEAEFDAAGAHLLDSLKKFQVAQTETNELMSIIGSFKKDIVETKAKPSPMPVPPRVMSLWDRLGGEDAVKAVVHEAVAAAAKDPKVNITRNGKYKLDEKGIANLEKLLVDFISANTGGSRKYTGLDMKTAHAGMGITEAEFDALGAIMVEALKKFKVPQKEIDDLVAVVAKTKKDIVEK